MLRRAVFSDYQRKGLEKRFQIQKYISKPDRKKLAEKLGLKDSQVSTIFKYYFVKIQLLFSLAILI